MGSVTVAASQVSLVMSARSPVLLIVSQLNVFREQDIVWVYVSLDSMVTIATAHVQQTVILLSVIKSQVTVMEDVLLVSMVTNAHRFALQIAKTLVIKTQGSAPPVVWGFMETSVQTSAI